MTNNEQTKKEYIKKRVLSLIPMTKDEAITSKEIQNATGLTFRALKQIITELRILYPICAKETNGGGYWMAENDFDIIEFTEMIKRRRDGYNKTLEVMKNHVGECK